MKALDAMEGYLRSANALEATVLGPGGGRPAPRDEARARQTMIEHLQQRHNENRWLLYIVVAVYVTLIAGGVALVFYLSPEPGKMTKVLGGNYLALGVLAFRLRDLWREKTMLDIVDAVIPWLDGDAAVKFIQSIYFAQKEKKTDVFGKVKGAQLGH